MQEQTTPEPELPAADIIIPFRELTDREKEKLARREKQRTSFMASLEPLFKNVKAMEERLMKKGKDPLQDKHYRRIAETLTRGVQYARSKGWLRMAKQSLN